ncbi:prion-inhibition and propagation domain-containing protein [Aspergillus stella-maris]|uniref:prion-inhibition and propagation domain-containing protein n=1 Tax=Aspergillus stella-maris TaxID=1810926 RepID=UPI003CCD1105
MEAAGLVLSVIALFGSCLQGYQLVSDIKGLGQDSAILLCRLQIEEKRLVIWGRTSGFTEETCRLPAQDLDTVLTVLRQIHSITQDAAVMKKRYGASIAPSESSSLQSSPTEYIQTSAVLSDLKRRVNEKTQSHSLATGLRFLFDRKNFERLVVDLRELNNGLYALLHGAQRMASLVDFHGVCLLSSANDDVNKLATLRDATESTYSGLSKTVDQRMHFLSLEDAPEDTRHESANCIPLESMTIIRPERDRNRSIAQKGDELFLIDWRPYAPELHDKYTFTIMKNRIASLSLLLGRKPKPQALHVLDCIGYCHDEPGNRFGIAWELPTLDVEDVPDIVPLYDLVHPQTGADRIFPTLNDRFKLASVLANSILQVHSAKWLHRNLRSSDIIFLKPARSKNLDWLKQPYITGFSYARPDTGFELSIPLVENDVEPDYSHPRMAGNRYCREFDAYSLGLILVEIGFWRPISAFRKSTYGARRNHMRLLEYQLKGDLAHRMGVDYEAAVRFLLLDRAYQGGTEGEQLVNFLENVVGKVYGKGLTQSEN